MVVTSEADFNRKTQTDNYYICNAHAVLAVVRHIFTPEFINVLSFYNKRPETQFLVNSYQDILLWLLRDVEDLTSLYAENIQQRRHERHQGHQNQQSQQCERLYRSSIHSSDSFNSSIRSFIRNRYVHTASLYQVFRQGLFGSISEHSFTDKEPSSNIATIRQLIELRLRRAFGVLAFEDAYKHNAIEPLNMSLLFNVLKQYSDKIQINGIKLESLNRIYTWSNSFIHSGLGDYSWIPVYLEIVLRGAFFGHNKADGSWNINNGISTQTNVIRSIWTDLIKLVNDGKDSKNDETARYKLVILRNPECELIPDSIGIAAATAINAVSKADTANTTDVTENVTGLRGNKSSRSNGSNKNDQKIHSKKIKEMILWHQQTMW